MTCFSFRYRFTIILIALTVLSCEKKAKEDDVYIGTASALRNGEYWATECVSFDNESNPNTIRLIISKFSNPSGRYNTIFIGNIDKISSRFRVVNALGIEPFPSYGTYCSTFLENDVVEGMYYIVDIENNYIDISKLDNKTKEICGTFSLTFALDSVRSQNPDTLRFTNGQFKTKISRYPD